MDFSTEIWKDWQFGYQFSTCGRLRRIEAGGRQVPGFLLKPKAERSKPAYYFTVQGKYMGRAVVEIWAAVWPDFPPIRFDRAWGKLVEARNTLDNFRLCSQYKRESVKSSAPREQTQWALNHCPYASGEISMPGFDYKRHLDLGLGCWGHADEN